MVLTRRSFLQHASALCLVHALPSFATSQSSSLPTPAPQKLTDGWEFYQGPLDAALQVWNSEELVTWEKVTLPHCFNHYDACDPDTPAYRGQGWYRKTLRVNNPYANGRTLLHLEGAGQSSSIYINGKNIAEHNGGYDEFDVDITDAVAHPDSVKLAILCDNGRDPNRMPSDLSDFTLYGGLYRAVHLVYLPAVSLEVVHTTIAFEPGKQATVTVTGRLYTPKAMPENLTLQVSITSPAGKVIHQQDVQKKTWTDEAELATITIDQPQTWSPSHPELYTCRVSLGPTEQRSVAEHRFGIRHARWEDHGPFFLNSERLALRGTQRHEDHAGYAAAMPDDLIRQELQMMRDMGVNFLRLAHYQQSRLVLELCDELGILVWEEVPWCRSGVLGATFQQRGHEQLARMIDQHRNHPSVLMWGLGNEDDWPTEPNGEDHEAIRRYMRELHNLAHQLDPSRVTCYRRCDFAADIPDVYSPSIWAGWYSGAFTEYRSALEKARPKYKHLFHAEWGADSHAGRHAEDPDPALAHIRTGGSTAEQGFDYKLNGGALRMAKDGEWSETYACDLFDWYLKTQEELPWLTGTAQWVFKDFTTPLRVDNPVPRVNQKGVITRDMQPKEGYYVFQSYWSNKPMLRIYGHNWPMRWGRIGQERMVRVYSNCTDVELFLNGKSLGRRHRDSQDYPCAGLRWHASFTEGHNTLRAVGVHADGKLEDSVSFHYETRTWAKPSQLALTRLRRDGHHSVLQAELLDAQGVRCLNSRAVVHFNVAGDGTMIDNLGTPSGSRTVQLYNGRAEITVVHTKQIALGVRMNDLSTVASFAGSA